MKTTKVRDESAKEPEHGQGVRAQVTLRRAELDQRLAQLQNSDQQGTVVPQTIESELAVLDAMLPADLAHISPVVAAQLTQWLDANKYLGADAHKKPRSRIG